MIVLRYIGNIFVEVYRTVPTWFSPSAWRDLLR